MPPELTDKAWAQIRYEYEHGDRPIDDICAAHGISSGTLRDRRRRWGWMRRRPPIPPEGPPPTLAPAPRFSTIAAPPPATWEDDIATPTLAAAPPIETALPCAAAMPQVPASDDASAPDDTAIVPRLQSAVARVLPAIEATVVKLGAGPMQPREMEQTARALASLTRTLRELNGLLSERQTATGRVCDCDDMPEDIDAFRYDLARRINAFVASRAGEAEGGAGASREGSDAVG